MKTNALFLSALALATSACHGPIPEGRYPCATATVATDCPPLWFCRADHTCWITPDSSDAMVPRDATITDAATPDSPMHDAGPSCVAETCNGTDDDCDGLIDEGVMTVGPAVPATTDTDALGARLAATSNGFAIVAGNVAGGLAWLAIDGHGSPMGSIVDLGGDVTRTVGAFPFAIAGGASPTQFFVATAIDVMQPSVLVGLDAHTRARVTGATAYALPTPLGFYPAGYFVVAPTSASRITVYSMHQPNPLGGAQRLHRTRLDISTGTPSIVSELDAAVDARAASLGAFAAISTHDADFVVYVNSSGTQLLAGPSGDAVGMFHVVGSFSSSTLAALDLAIRDASQPVSPSNPIGVLFAVSSGGGPALAVIEVTNTTALATGPMIGLPGVTQPQRSLATPHWATVRSLGDHGSSGHWIVANVNHDPSAPTGSASSVVLVHEVLGDGSSVRTVSVPGESYADRTTIEIAQSGASIRLVERANGTGLVTRSIACE